MSYNEVVAQYSTLSRIARIAEDQWGLITRRQAEAAGVSQATLHRLAKTGTLDRVAHGVYRLAGAPPPDYPGLRAAWLQLAPEVPAWERSPLLSDWRWWEGCRLSITQSGAGRVT